MVSEINDGGATARVRSFLEYKFDGALCRYRTFELPRQEPVDLCFEVAEQLGWRFVGWTAADSRWATFRRT